MMAALRTSLFLLTLALPVAAQEDLHGVVGLRGTAVGYAQNAPRDRLVSYGAFIDLDQRSLFGVSLSFDHDILDYKTGFQTPQDNVAGGLRFYLPLGEGDGKLILRGEARHLAYDESATLNRVVNISGMHLGYLSDVHPELARFYADAGYIRSRYDWGLEVRQTSPTLGFGFRDNREWFSLGTDLIQLRGEALADGTNQTRSFTATWTHYPVQGQAWKPYSLFLSVMGGERVYGVDADSPVVFNFGDVQTGRGSLGLTWKRATGLGFSLEGGSSRFEIRSRTSVASYTNSYLSTSIHFSW